MNHLWKMETLPICWHCSQCLRDSWTCLSTSLWPCSGTWGQTSRRGGSWRSYCRPSESHLRFKYLLFSWYWRLHTNDCEDRIDGGVSQVSVGRVIKVLAGGDGVEVDHVGGDEDGGQDVAEDEDADDGQQRVHAVLVRWYEMSTFILINKKSYSVMVVRVRMALAEFVLPITADQPEQPNVCIAYDDDRKRYSEQSK